MVSKLGSLRKVKLLKNNGDKAVVRSPEKAGVGGSTPSLATIFSSSYVKFSNHPLCTMRLPSWVEHQFKAARQRDSSSLIFIDLFVDESLRSAALHRFCALAV